MRRRRRRDYTPEQEASRVELHAAEMWLDIVSSGIAEGLKHERYCGDGMRQIIGHVNGELLSAVVRLEEAQKIHAEIFQRRSLVVIGRSGKNPTKKKKASVPTGTKATEVAPESTNQRKKRIL